MKKILATDNSLKVISVLIAICIWVYIALVMDPPIEVTVRDLPIQFTGQEVLASKNLAVISESATTVSVKVKGSRKKMGNNDMDTIIAKADVQSAAKGTTTVPIEIVIPFENQGISSQSLYSVDVKVESIAEKTLEVGVVTSGSLAQSYMCGDITCTPEKITVKGPESAIEQLSKAVVKLNFGGADVDIDANLPVVFHDANGKEIAALDAILKRITVSPNTVAVHCPVVKIREITPTANFGWQELPENFSYKIEPSVLYTYTSDGTAVRIDKIETEEISLDKLLENEKVKVRLRIPSGIKILNDVTEVEISVK